MLATLDAHQLARWRAYEKVNGPLDDTWSQEVLARIHEMLQVQYVRDPDKIHPIQRPWTIPKEKLSEEQLAKQKADEEAKKAATVTALDEALMKQDKGR